MVESLICSISLVFLWANDDGGNCQYLLNTMCQVLFLGSRCISSLFTFLWSIFSLIYRREIWLSCNLHGKKKFILSLNAQYLSLLPFIFLVHTWECCLTFCLIYLLFANFISFSLWAHSFPTPLPRQIRPDCHSSLSPSFPPPTPSSKAVLAFLTEQ